METLKKLIEKNPEISFFSVDSEEFKSFGRIIDSIDPTEIIETAKKISNLENGSSYVPSEKSFEELSIAKEIADKCFGELPTQIGYCWGHNTMFNATEWHTSSEINIAVTPMVLILGHIWDIKNEKANSADFKAFYVPQGTVIEVYSTSLHFCPCETEKTGFGSVVALPCGTNTPLERESSDKLLFRKNKWLLCHKDNADLIAKGVVPGISGINYEIKY